MRYSAFEPTMLRRYLSALLPVALFCAALIALHRLGGEFHLGDVLAEFSAIGHRSVLLAIALTAGSYLVLTGYERLALGFIGRTLPWSKYALTSFIAYAIGHNLGVAALSGGAIRYRIYTPLGFGAMEIAQIVAFCTVTFALGASTLAGISMIANAGEAASLLHSTAKLSIALGVLALSAVAGYLLACALRRTPLSWRDASIRLPTLQTALVQIALAVVDLTLASSVLYVLLPASADVSYLVFAGLYMVALAASLLSLVPGGLGVFETIMVLLLPGVPAPQMLAALLAYRLVYYALPFGMALMLLSAHEIRQQRARLTAAWTWTQRSLDFVVPQAVALLVFGAGFLLLLSGATPGMSSRLAALDRFLPLSVLELSHLAGSAVGVLLLILARGLVLRLDAAWQLTMSLLGAGILASLLKGLDFEEALFLAAAMLPLWWTRKQFYRKSSLLSEPLSPAWFASAGIAIGASIWIGMLAYRHVPYADELWWQFALHGQASRMLRASLLAVLVFGSIAAFRLLAPARSAPALPSIAELDRALTVIHSSPDASANLALLGDKSLLFSNSGRSFVMYGVAHRCWVAMGDPVGSAEEREELVWSFRELADRVAAWSVFYQVSPENLPLYVDAGLALSKLGEEARVRLEAFSLDGSSRASLRQSHRRARRDGLVFRIAGADQVASLLPRLRQVSDEWLQSKAVAEKGFSLGRFSEAYLCRFPVALVERSDQVVGFADLWQGAGREELSVDLMRHSNSAPGGVMDFLFIELMLWAKAQGYRWFNLGMAPLAGLEAHRLAPAWHKVGRLIYHYGENFYNFEGLRRYKEKFEPEWRPRYLAAPGGLAQARVLLEVASLISGGLVETIRKDTTGQR